MSAPIYQEDLRDGATSSAGVISRSQPRWINPCGLPGHVFDPESDTEGMSDVPPSILYDTIIKYAQDARRQAIRVKAEFLNHTLADSHFEEGVKDIKGQKWLPDIPKATEGHFRLIRQDEAFKSTYEMLQYFAVGIQQIVLDETLNEGYFVDMFRETETYLNAVLCELQMGMYILRIKPNPDVLEAVMSQEYRDTDDRTVRRMRDYFIIRDYIKAVEYVAQLFAYLKSKL